MIYRYRKLHLAPSYTDDERRLLVILRSFRSRFEISSSITTYVPILPDITEMRQVIFLILLILIPKPMANNSTNTKIANLTLELES